MVTTEPIALEAATQADGRLLSNLLELYSHDMSEFLPVETGPDGRYGYKWLPFYWSEPDRRFAFLFRAGSRVVGFALVTRGSPASDDPDVLDMAEFFVLRRYRRAGVGRSAVSLLWDRMPGRWTVRVSEGNRPGLPFWDAAVRAHAHGAVSVESREGTPHRWRVFTFETASRRPS